MYEWNKPEVKGEEKEGKVSYTRECFYSGITLEEALMFRDENWCEAFFKSIEDMHMAHENRHLFLDWKIRKSELTDPDIPVAWKVIAARGGYPKEVTPENFGKKVFEDHQPNMFDVEGPRKDRDIVMICPGEGKPDQPGNKGGLGGRLQQGRCKHLANFMCPGENEDYNTKDEEKKDLWKLVGKTALERLNGTLERKIREKGRWKKTEDGEYETQIASIDKEGHKELTISTHGYGVSWLHVRVETNPQYPNNAK